MRQILLLRHAKSSWDDTAQSDHARTLDESGLAAAAAMGAALRGLGLAPDLILVSSARRTLQTLEALEPWDEAPLIEPLDGLYLASAQQILAILRRVTETVRSVMVIGHNPGLHDVAMILAGAHALAAGTKPVARLAGGFPTGALAEYTVAAHWPNLAKAADGWSASSARKICRGPPLTSVADNPAAATPSPVIELDVDPADLAKLWRAGPLVAARRGRARTVVCRRIWHDTAGFALRGHGLALSEQNGVWRLERLTPAGAAEWPPAGPAPVLAEGPDPALLGRKLTPAILGALVPIAAFSGTSRGLKLAIGGVPASLDVVHGALRGVARDEPACRLILSGPGPAMAGLAAALAPMIRLTIPRAGLAARAIALAQGTAPAPRQLGAPSIPHGLAVSDALVLVIAHLTDVILHWATMVPAYPPGANPEPVHQMRVAVRRLRSALAIFRRATGGQEADALFRSLGHALKALAATLGAARDWDVFLDGAGAEVGAAFAGDKRIASLLAAASRKRLAAYATLNAHLAGPTWRDLALRLALLPTARPWVVPVPAQPERDEFGELRAVDVHASLIAAPAEAYASQALHRSLKRVTRAGEDLATLPPDALHEARKNGKQLRYACEFFAPLFPVKATRRFLERLEDLQEALGAVNDSHVAASLMEQLSGGADGRFATGVVLGYVAATNAPAARRAGKAWDKLLKQPVFWT